MPVTRMIIGVAPLWGLTILIVLALLLCTASHAQTLSLPTSDAPFGGSTDTPGSSDSGSSDASSSDSGSSDDSSDSDPTSVLDTTDPDDADESTFDLGMMFDPDAPDDADPSSDSSSDPGLADSDPSLAEYDDNDMEDVDPGTDAWMPLIASTPSNYPNAVPILGWPGALGLNIGWQSLPQTSPRPLVQVQGAAGDDLLNQSGYGFSATRQAAADADWVEIDWMRKYLVPTGEFPGNGNGTPGNNFFDMMNGMASFTRGARAIAQSSAWNPVYGAKVAQETPVWNSVCKWLTTPDVKSIGDAYNAPFTHRYWMGACVMRNESYLLRLLGGASNTAQAAVYDAVAVDYENQAMARQVGPGWMLAMYPKFSNGLFRASILYNPAAGDPIPVYFDGTKSNHQLYAEGVNPEEGDDNNQTWDAIYNPNGDKLAVWGIAVQASGSHRQACSQAVDMNLLCAMQFLTSARDNTGAPILITPDGSGRVGSLDINGNPKKIDPKAWRSIFQVQSGLAPDHNIYGGSHSSECRALFAEVFHWLDNVIRNPSASIPAPPAIPSSLYPTS